MKGHAYAKINLGLQVLATFDNGYHDLDMIMMPLDLYDILTIEPNGSNQDHFFCNIGGKHFLHDNTVLDAIKLMRTTFTQITDHFDIRLIKRIPSQAGLGGGSADGACALKMINRMYSLGLTMAQLMELGVKIGADVPFCIANAPSRVKGIGENVRRFRNQLNPVIILVKPSQGVSTGECFKLCNDHGDGHINNELEFALRDGDYLKTCALLNNSLEQPAMQLVPKIKSLKDQLLSLGCDGAIMSGSGSTAFGLCKDEIQAKSIAKIMRTNAAFVHICHFYSPRLRCR